MAAPKAIDRDPMIGPHPDCPRILALTGGFKVSFGLAHHLAESVVGFHHREQRAVPASFLFSAHLKVAFGA